MCLVALAWQQHPELPLVIAANRDERFDRPSDELDWWPNKPDIAGGRDQVAGGTWLALHRNGRFGIVTNYRERPGRGDKPRSRGDLVTEWLEGSDNVEHYASMVRSRGSDYAGFNLLYGDRHTLGYVSNRTDRHGPLEPGVYALSNGLLDSAWPKVGAARRTMEQAVGAGRRDPYAFLPFFTDTTQAPDGLLPEEDLPIENRRALSAPFILNRTYGTRCSTIASYDVDGGAQIFEQRYGPGGATDGQSSLNFMLTAD